MRKKIIAFILIIEFLLVVHASAQNQIDSSKYLNPYVSTLKSLIVPGWAQVNQERLWQAAFFYFGSLHFYYNAFFQLYHYQKGHARYHYYAFRWNLSAALFVHLLNVVDAAEVAFHEKPTGWQGGLFSDKPLKSPWGAALRSAMLPGWGQVYTKSPVKAIGFFVVDGYLAFRMRQADIKYRATRNRKYRDERSKYSWYFGLAYLLTMADAYASAYLYQFDEAMKLTFVPVMSVNFWGLHAQIHF